MIKRLTLAVSLILVSICLSMAQTNKVDSLNTELQILKLKAQIDSLKAVNTKAPIISQPINNEEYAARQDALKKDILNLKAELKESKMCLRDFQRQYRTGTNLYFVGLLLASVSSFIIVSNNKNSDKMFSYIGLVGLIGGLGLNTAGYIVWIDAHRHIGYAGEFKKQ